MAETGERDYQERSYGAQQIGFGHRPAVVVIDFQKAFTDPQYPLGGAPLVMRAVDQTSRLLEVARRYNFPVASCHTAYKDEREMPYWKVGAVHEQFLLDHPSSELDPKIYEPGYDMALRKTGASIFFQTPVVPFFVRARVDTVIVTGCITSGCVRASTIDSFQWGFRTIVPEDCVGDHEEQPHEDNLRDVGRRYADISSADEVIAYFEEVGRRNM